MKDDRKHQSDSRKSWGLEGAGGGVGGGVGVGGSIGVVRFEGGWRGGEVSRVSFGRGFMWGFGWVFFFGVLVFIFEVLFMLFEALILNDIKS
jgi:hypothetical protein